MVTTMSLQEILVNEFCYYPNVCEIEMKDAPIQETWLMLCYEEISLPHVYLNWLGYVEDGISLPHACLNQNCYGCSENPPPWVSVPE